MDPPPTNAEEPQLARSSSYLDAVADFPLRDSDDLAQLAATGHVEAKKKLVDLEMDGPSKGDAANAKTPQEMQRPRKPYVHPMDWALWNPINLFSFISFHWVHKYLALGARRPLEFEDMIPLWKQDSTLVLTDRLAKHWHVQTKQPNPSLLKAYFGAFGAFFVFCSFFLALEAAVQIAQPVLLGKLIENLQVGGSVTEAYLYGLGLALTAAFYTLSHHVGFLYSWRLGFVFRSATIGLIYRKILRVSRRGLGNITTGKLVNIISNDVERFIFAGIAVHFLWIGPLQLAVVTWLAWDQLGWPVMCGTGLLIVLVPVNLWTSRLFQRLRGQTAACTDERVKIMNEIVGGARVLKMYAWEKPFGELVARLRARELGFIRFTAKVRSSYMAFFFCSSALISFLMFLPYNLIGNTLTAAKVFTTLALYGAVRGSMTTFFPQAIQAVSELRSVLQRVEHILTREDLHGVPPIYAEEEEVKEVKETAVQRPFLQFTNVTGAWLDDTRDIVTDISCRVVAGECVAVVGPIGAGKSTLLMMALRELEPRLGTVTSAGRFAYASQQAWILSDTVRENIIFGEPYEEAWYQSVVTACQLREDFASFSHGDLTEIGERGVTLSGGQKARVSLARAVYSRADIYLLDDPLSAVDANVAHALFDQCIRGLLRDKVVMLVTHQLQFVSQVTRILALTKTGTIFGQGSYEELMRLGFNVENVITDDAKMLAEDAAKAGAATAVATPATKSGAGALIKNEDKQSGVIEWGTYWNYVRAGGGPWAFVIMLTLFVVTQVNSVIADWYLAYWTNLDPEKRTENKYIGIYGGLIGSLLLFAMVRALHFMKTALDAANSMHANAFDAVIHTPIRFFDVNPVGRVLNRFSKDTGYMDELLPWTFLDFLQGAFAIVGIVLLASFANPWVFLIAAPLTVIFFFVRNFFLKSAREVKRLEAIARSPMYSHFSSSLLGLATIRSHHGIHRFEKQMWHHQDGHSRMFMMFVFTSRWLGFRLDLMTFAFITVTIFAALGARDTLNPSLIGLSLAYVLQLTASFQWIVRQSAEVENQMTSIERILEYSKLPREQAPTEVPKGFDRDAWPSRGEIEFHDVTLRYEENSDDVLKGLSFRIAAGEKIGVVGRTGAGKSSLIAALFRLSPTRGSIRIDGVDTATLPLEVLRSSMSVIPQEPVLFSGTMAYNLDPFGVVDDARLWRVVDDVHLRPAVEMLGSNGLRSSVTESGGNLSLGQRQLVCFARCLLRTHNRILVLDEATANVDTDTDALIQATIRAQFSNWTIITVAHRLNTIVDSDRIMVLDAGRVVEFAPPEQLLDNEAGIFSSLARRSSISRASFSRRSVSSAAGSYRPSLGSVKERTVFSVVV